MVRIYNFFYGIMWVLFYFFGAAFTIAALETRQEQAAQRVLSVDVAILAITGAALLLMIRAFCYGCAGRLTAPRVPAPAKA